MVSAVTRSWSSIWRIKKGRWHPLTTLRRSWMAQPLRSRLALITTGLLTTGLLIATMSVTSLLNTHLIRQIDDQLRVTAETIGRQGLSQIRTGEGPGMPSTYYSRPSTSTARRAG